MNSYIPLDGKKIQVLKFMVQNKKINDVNECELLIEKLEEDIQNYLEAALQIKLSINTSQELLSELKEIKKQIEESNKKKTYKTIDELISNVDNPNQVAILNRIITDKEYSKIYLSGYEPNTDKTGKKKFLIGSVKVLGTFNEKKQSREEYDIKIFQEDPKGMFWCSCADHKFNSTKKNIVCKHICFLICKIGKFLTPEIFAEKKLSEQDLATLLSKLTASDIWKDQTVAIILSKITLKSFKQFLKAIDDCCPVCFNDLTDDDKPELLACPTCKNYIHSECAEIWLEQKECCAMCKSDYWKYYDKVKSGGTVSIKN